MEEELSALERFAQDERLSENESRLIDSLPPLEKFVLNARFVKEDERRERHKAYLSDMMALKRHPPTVPSFPQACDIVPDMLALHGFSHSYQIEQDGETITVNCQLTHRQGHSEGVSFSLPADEEDVTSMVTYLQGITLMLLTGLIPQDELD